VLAPMLLMPRSCDRALFAARLAAAVFARV
jgi:hypothetical protein